jgi:5'-nucleotidase
MLILKSLLIPAALLLTAPPLSANLTLTVLHFSDAESHLVGAGEPSATPDAENDPSSPAAYGGAARFVKALETLRAETTGPVLTVSSGDNLLPGPALDASDSSRNGANSGGVDYDALFFALAKVDASAAGNHDFDLGPARLARFAQAGHADGGSMRLLSCNVDASASPELAPLVAPYAVFDCGGSKVGLIGVTTWVLPDISAPAPVHLIDADGDGDTDVDDAAALVNKSVDELSAQGVNHILLLSHLQGLRNDQNLVRRLRGVDAVISGGGHEVLADPDLARIPLAGPEAGPYPLYTNSDGAPVRDREGVAVPIVTAGSHLRYVGRLTLEFDDAGHVLAATGGPVLVSGFDSTTLPHARPFERDAETLEKVETPVRAFLADLASSVGAVTEVSLDGTRAAVRSRETNLGDLAADAFLHAGQVLAREFGRPEPVAAIVNGGDIRIDSALGPGPLTRIQLRAILPFPNQVALAENICPARFKKVAEHMLAAAPDQCGAFGQIAGFTVECDLAAAPGSRVKTLTLADGTRIVADGLPVPGAPKVSLAVPGFLAQGGDGYPLAKTQVFLTPLRQDGALEAYFAKVLRGKVDAAAYPEGGLGRIRILPAANARSQ